MTVHRFAYSLEGDPIPEEASQTIDGAIFTAGRLWAKYRTTIFVREVAGGQSRARGIVDAAGWHWLISCPRCKGTGEIMRRSPQAPALMSKATCTRCFGCKLVKGDT
jgi:hypothetical protein